MKDQFKTFDKIYVENKIKNHINTKNIISKINFNDQIEYFDDIQKLIKNTPLTYHPELRSKKLVLSSIRGDILRKCPGTHGHICCNYYVINLYIGCPIGCSYCILQSYLNQSFTIINIDIENIFDEIKTITKNNPDKIFRLGTGELGDSLVYDYLTDYSIDFINFFSGIKNCIFEFKTKTDNIENILKIKSPDNIVVGFSVNPQTVIDDEEKHATKLINRMKAAQKLIKNGYKISLHFDPIINISDFEKKYNELIEIIFTYIKPENISWISLGTFRYTPELKNMMEYNYPESKLLYDEFVENQDKKFRYFKPIRLNLLNSIINHLKFKSENLLIYLCMESPYIWKNCLNYLPYNENKMDLLFKNAINN